MISILSLSYEKIVSYLENLGEPPYRAKQLCQWLYQRKVVSFNELTNMSLNLRNQLNELFTITGLNSEQIVSQDGAIKYRFTLNDGNTVESVWIPEAKRNTLCISSQVGCGLGCKFCVTGMLGFVRNLSIDEIIAQVRHVKLLEEKPVSNVVFMGMGEPLLNSRNVIEAINILSSNQMMAIGRRKITVSTAGVVPNILPFLDSVDVKFAISLTGATDEIRNQWMPINQKYGLQSLLSTVKKIHLPKGKKIMFEYILIDQKTDSEEDAQSLVKLLKGVPAKVNLIPYNETDVFPELKTPSDERIEQFQTVLYKNNIHATIRKSRGRDICGACGQLGKIVEHSKP